MSLVSDIGRNQMCIKPKKKKKKKTLIELDLSREDMGTTVGYKQGWLGALLWRYSTRVSAGAGVVGVPYGVQH